MNNYYTQLSSIGLFLLWQMLFIQLSIGIMWHLNVSIISYSWLIGFLLSCLFSYLFSNRKVCTIALSLGVWAVAVAVVCFFPDFSTDGQLYHQPMIFALANGWNPILEHHNKIIADGWGVNIWLDHYCKGLEMLSASIFAITGNIESGKAINIVMPISFMLLLYSFVTEKFRRLGHRRLILFSIISSIPVIFASQMFTYYIDWCSYYIISLLLLACWHLYFNQVKGCLLISIPVLFLSIGIKLNIAFYAVFFLLFMATFIIAMNKTTKIVLKVGGVLLITGLISVCITNYNPYITNIIDHGNPIYPMSSNNEGMDFLNNGAEPDYIRQWPRLHKIVYSILSTPSNDHKEFHHPLELSKFEDLSNPAPVIGGWGMLFPSILICSVLLFLFSRKTMMKIWTAAFVFLLFSTLFVLPYGSCYRYVPFTSIIPIILLFYLDNYNDKRWIKNMGSFLYILLLVNFVITLTSTSILSVSNKIATSYYRKQIVSSSGINKYITESWAFNFKIYGNHVENNNVYLKLKDKSVYEWLDKGDSNYKRAHIQPLKLYIDTTKVDINGNKTKIESIILPNND